MRLVNKLKHWIKIVLIGCLLWNLFDKVSSNELLGHFFENLALLGLAFLLFTISIKLIIEFSKYFEDQKSNYRKYNSLNAFVKTKKMIVLIKTLLCLFPIANYRVYLLLVDINKIESNYSLLITLVIIANLALLCSFVSYVLFLTYYFNYRNKNLEKWEKELDYILYEANLDPNSLVYINLLAFYKEMSIDFNLTMKYFISNGKKLRDLKVKILHSKFLVSQKKASTPPII
ncbi:hypothetical protein SGLAD_v1c01280 [Spiroplasma gladiatoris]|uniref:Uncharacterized protein n=1 Tax=Spiroplasma gladiatoris TaxID=2143 RepID=A0A4P7AGR2_9MOLU|nr:hypothetical protein [Spiroplasma gladiatoris]QBQ07327.1 hypothetical protein SGLAD_v1c01280 [Spiroplasma gladiatoris]